LPQELIEYLIACDTGWDLDYIKNLPVKDHARFTLFAQVKHQIYAVLEDNKIQASLAALGNVGL